MGTLLDRQLPRSSPLARQIARLAKALPAEPPRLEILRFSFGVGPAALPAACRRLNLAGGAHRRACASAPSSAPANRW